jgi:acetoin utilization deacetylase AcuC-like enzyme
VTRQTHEQLLDEVVDAYVDWREESTEVWDAYERWSRAPAADAPLAFSAYCAAVDREERASYVYAELMTRAAAPGHHCPPGTALARWVD